MADTAPAAPETQAAERKFGAERELPGSPTSAATPGFAWALSGMDQMMSRLPSADRSERARVVSGLQRSHGNHAVASLLTAGRPQRAPAGGAGPVTVREIGADELVDLVKNHPERVLFTELEEGERLVFDNAWREGGGKGQVAAFEDGVKNIRVATRRLSDGVRARVYGIVKQHHAAAAKAAAEKSAAQAAERQAAGLADTGAAELRPAGGAEAKAGGAEAKLGKAETQIAGVGAQGAGGVAAPAVREVGEEELVSLIKQNPERVLLTELEEGERVVFDNAWKKGGGKGQVAAFVQEETKKIRVAPSRLSEGTRGQVYEILKQHNLVSGETAAAERSAARGAKKVRPMHETPASPSAIEGPEGAGSKAGSAEGKASTVEAKANTAEAKASTVEAKASSVEAKASTVEAKATGVEAKATGVEAKASTVEAKAALAETEVAAAEVKAMKAEGTAFKVAQEAAQVGRLSKLGSLLLELGLPGPWDVFFMFISAFGSIAEAKAELRAREFTLGFGAGIAAALLNQSPSDAIIWASTPSVGEMAAGFEGQRDKGHNEGVVAGYKFGKALNATQRQGFLTELKKGLSEHNTLRFLTGDFKRDSADMGVAFKPTVDKLLEEAERQEEAKRRQAQIDAERMRNEMGAYRFRR